MPTPPPPQLQQQQNSPVTARLRPVLTLSRFGMALALILPSAFAGAFLHAAFFGGSSGGHYPLPTVAPYTADPTDHLLLKSRVDNAAGYLSSWANRIGKDGTAHITPTELRSCYNILTMRVLPTGRRESHPRHEDTP